MNQKHSDLGIRPGEGPDATPYYKDESETSMRNDELLLGSRKQTPALHSLGGKLEGWKSHLRRKDPCDPCVGSPWQAAGSLSGPSAAGPGRQSVPPRSQGFQSANPSSTNAQQRIIIHVKGTVRN